MPNWVRQWSVPSSSGGGDYIVSEDKDGTFACGCPGWTRNIKNFCPECNGAIQKNKNSIYPPKGDTLYCPSCKRYVVPRRERINCKHIVLCRMGGGVSLEQAVMNRMRR